MVQPVPILVGTRTHGLNGAQGLPNPPLPSQEILEASIGVFLVSELSSGSWVLGDGEEGRDGGWRGKVREDDGEERVINRKE